MQKIDVTCTNLPEFRYHPVSGGFGGVTPYGQILLALYHEHGETPARVTVVIDDAGKPTEQPLGVLPVVRDVLFGMQLTPEQALAIGNWLVQNANQAMESLTTKKVTVTSGSSVPSRNN
ncbi:MAG: hypothetical protein ACYDCJ_13535 [Gammaproteobacteria bacterium]